jgi:hypothetical protein
MNRHIHEIRKRLVEQRRRLHHNHTQHQLLSEGTTTQTALDQGASGAGVSFVNSNERSVYQVMN